MYLPRNDDDGVDEGYVNLNAPYQYIDAGQWVDIETEWEKSIPVLAKTRTLIPIGRAQQTLSPGEQRNPAKLQLDDYRAVELFPPTGKNSSNEYHNSWLENDGISPVPSAILQIGLVYVCNEDTIDIVEYSHTMLNDDGRTYQPAWKVLHFILTIGDERLVTFKGKHMVRSTFQLGGRACFEMCVEEMLDH
jgi:hypothetical protein